MVLLFIVMDIIFQSINNEKKAFVMKYHYNSLILFTCITFKIDIIKKALLYAKLFQILHFVYSSVFQLSAGKKKTHFQNLATKRFSTFNGHSMSS